MNTLRLREGRKLKLEEQERKRNPEREKETGLRRAGAHALARAAYLIFASRQFF
jgi:hypothetical protein